MFSVPLVDPSPEFVNCWRVGYEHLNRLGRGSLVWLRRNLNPPFLEHLSFRLGNQLFFVCCVAEGVAPFSDDAARELQRFAESCEGHACILPLTQTQNGWAPAIGGWGLIELATMREIDPDECVTDELVEMTDWELQDFAVGFVCKFIVDSGRKLTSWASYVDWSPSVWFIGDGGPEWVLVKVVRYPDDRPSDKPENWEEIAIGVSNVSASGHFAPMSVANAHEQFDSDHSPPTPLWRGQGLIVSFGGFA